MGKKLTIQEKVILVFIFAKGGVTYRSVAEPLDQNRSRTLDDLKDAITTECQRISIRSKPSTE